jgi:hypothetical protein
MAFKKDDILSFYLNHVFDHIDQEKWCKNRPLHYWVEKDGFIVAALTITKRIPETFCNGSGAGSSSGSASGSGAIDHIWLCGVRDDQRGKGLFAGLIQHFKENCTDIISVATYPEKWLNMYAWIKKKGGKLIHKSEDGKCVFIIFKKDL